MGTSGMSNCFFWGYFVYILIKWQKQPIRRALRKRCSENMQQIYRRTKQSNFIEIAALLSGGLLLKWPQRRFSTYFSISIFFICFTNIFLVKEKSQDNSIWVNISELFDCCLPEIENKFGQIPVRSKTRTFSGFIVNFDEATNRKDYNFEIQEQNFIEAFQLWLEFYDFLTNFKRYFCYVGVYLTWI